jgi:hypothetical protein
MLNTSTLIATGAQLPLAALGDAIDALIALYDAAAGDPDLELNGDELDGSIAEDDFADHPQHYGAGCAIADSDYEHDGCEEELAQ